MSYKLEKPFTQTEYADFIIKYNHNLGLSISETDLAVFALEENEIIKNGKPIINPNFEEEKAQEEKNRIAHLTCTKRVLALGLQEYGLTYAKLKELIATDEQAQLEWDLCVELERCNPLLDIMGAKLGITSTQIDNIFKVANGEVINE